MSLSEVDIANVHFSTLPKYDNIALLAALSYLID